MRRDSNSKQTEDRMEEIKIDHYNRKLMGTTGPNGQQEKHILTQESKDNEKGISSENQ